MEDHIQLDDVEVTILFVMVVMATTQMPIHVMELMDAKMTLI